jgi:hypothetical protein
LSARVRREFAKIRDANPVLFAPPSVFPKPQRVSLVARAPRPGRVNEEIVNVLLRVVDDSRNVLIRFVDELPQPAGVLSSEPLVTRSNCRLQILTEKPDDPFLGGVGHHMSLLLKTGQCFAGLALCHNFCRHPRCHPNSERPLTGCVSYDRGTHVPRSRRSHPRAPCSRS